MALTEKYVTNSGAGAADGSSLANAWSWATMLTSLTAGQRANVQGAITRTTQSDVFTNSGTAANPMAIRGINSTLDDLEANGRTRGGALVTTNFPVITYTTGGLTLPAACTAEHLSITSAKTGSTLDASASLANVRRCSITNTHASSAAAIAISASSTGSIVDCDASIASSSSSAKAVNGSSAGCVVEDCLITGNTSGAGCVVFGNTGTLIRCTLRDAGFGVQFNGGTGALIGCSFRNITNIYVKGGVSIRIIQNNVAWGVGGSSQWYQSAGTVVENNQLYNFVGNMGVADADLGNWLNRGAVTLTADPFTSSADLTLNNTAGGGALVRAAGYPAYLDSGAWQHQDSGSGGGMIGGGNLNGGFQ